VIGILSIYGLGVLVCLLAGTAMRGLLEPNGRWIGFETVPLGLCSLMAILYVLGVALPATTGAPIALALVATGLAGGVALRGRRRRAEGVEGLDLKGAFTPAPPVIVTGLAAVTFGLLLLLPTLREGFPTTIAATNNDGWGYSGMVDWLKNHPFPRDVQPNIDLPMTLVPWNQNTHDFAIGFEHFGALLATVLGREGYQVVNAAAAVALVAAICGWGALLRAVRGRVDVAQAALVSVAVASPLVVTPFIENYTTQFVSICLWPFAIASFLDAVDRPGIRAIAVAGLGSAGVIGTYPALVPWLVPPLVAVALIGGGSSGWRGTMVGRLTGHRFVGALVALASLAVATVLVAPIQVVRAIQNLLFLDSAAVGSLGDFFSNDAYAALVVGATTPLALFPRGPLGWSVTTAVMVLVVVYLVALASPWGDGRQRWALLLIAGGLVLTTVAILVQYRVRSEYAYQVYKGLMSGGALIAGAVVVALLTPSTSRGRGPGLFGIGCCAALWIPSSAFLLQASSDNTTGFRAPEVQLDRALARLPAGSTVLVDGAAPDAQSFQLRMMSAYFGGQDPDLLMEGLGNTASYLTPGGLADWRPDEPWTEVLTTRPQPVTTARREIWSNGAYTLERAPRLDVATFGLGWYPPEDAEGTILSWTSGPSEILISNYAETPTSVRLMMTVASYALPRSMSLVAGSQRLTTRLAADTLTPVAMPLQLPAESVVSIQLSATPGPVAAPAGDGRQLMIRAQELRVVRAPSP
jgi:hypothetical protein